MPRPLHVLVVESERGGAEVAADDLEEAGHHVHRCRPEEADAFPCAAVDDAGACPFEGQPIDVAITLRPRPRSQVAAREDGVTCAIRRHVPLVVAGKTALNPFEEYATEIVGDEDVVAAVERAAESEPARLAKAAREALTSVLDVRDLPPEAGTVSIKRRDGGLDVLISLPDDIDKKARAMASVRVAGAIRQVDPSAAHVDVSVTSLGES